MRVESLQSRAISVLIALVLDCPSLFGPNHAGKCEPRSDRERSVGRFDQQGPGAVAQKRKVSIAQLN